jgi:hypothetical protein
MDQQEVKDVGESAHEKIAAKYKTPSLQITLINGAVTSWRQYEYVFKAVRLHRTQSAIHVKEQHLYLQEGDGIEEKRKRLFVPKHQGRLYVTGATDEPRTR